MGDGFGSEDTVTSRDAVPYGSEPDGPAERDEADLPRPGEVLANKYRIERLLGRGSMGAVFAAQHELLRERVVLKVILADLGGGDARARFLREARATFQIRSEHALRVLDVDFLDSGQPYMVLEYLEGQDLARKLACRGAPFEPTVAVDYMLQALDALAAAHALGIVHRDLKPANLFIVDEPSGPGRVKVLDFGIAKSPVERAGEELTVTKVLLGTPAYMSPEQVRSARSVDARADLWAIGVILYELLSGRRPYEGEAGEVCAAVLEQDVPPLLRLAPTTPPGLAEVVHRGLHRDLDRRYASAAELAAALAPFSSAPAAVPTTGARGARSAKLPLAISAVATVALLGVLPFALATRTPPRPATSASAVAATAPVVEGAASSTPEPEAEANMPAEPVGSGAPTAASAPPPSARVTRPRRPPRPRSGSDFDPTAARKL